VPTLAWGEQKVDLPWLQTATANSCITWNRTCHIDPNNQMVLTVHFVALNNNNAKCRLLNA